MSRGLRRKRSEETVQAITLQLEYVLKEYDIDLILLSDTHGLVIAWAGEHEAAEVFAVFADSLSKGEELDHAVLAVLPDITRERVICETITLDGIPLYLCAVMSPEVESCLGFERARTGIQRIYNTTGEYAGKS